METEEVFINNQIKSPWDDSPSRNNSFLPSDTLEDPWKPDNIEIEKLAIEETIEEPLEIASGPTNLPITESSKEASIDIDTKSSLDDKSNHLGLVINQPSSNPPRKRTESRRASENKLPPKGFIMNPEGSPYTSKSQTLSQIQNVFSDSQKIAYVGLCYLSINHFKTTRLSGHKKASLAYEKWSEQFMEKLYVYLDVIPEGTWL